MNHEDYADDGSSNLDEGPSNMELAGVNQERFEMMLEAVDDAAAAMAHAFDLMNAFVTEHRHARSSSSLGLADHNPNTGTSTHATVAEPMTGLAITVGSPARGMSRSSAPDVFLQQELASIPDQTTTAPTRDATPDQSESGAHAELSTSVPEPLPILPENNHSPSAMYREAKSDASLRSSSATPQADPEACPVPPSSRPVRSGAVKFLSTTAERPETLPADATGKDETMRVTERSKKGRTLATSATTPAAPRPSTQITAQVKKEPNQARTKKVATEKKSSKQTATKKEQTATKKKQTATKKTASKQPGSKPSGSKVKTDPEVVRGNVATKPATAYDSFLRTQMAIMKANEPNAKKVKLTSIITERWKDMSDSERKAYEPDAQTSSSTEPPFAAEAPSIAEGPRGPSSKRKVEVESDTDDEDGEGAEERFKPRFKRRKGDTDDFAADEEDGSDSSFGAKCGRHVK